MKSPQTLQQAIQFFGDHENCRQFMVSVRWLDGKVRCPYCDSEKVTYLEKAKLYRCYGDHPKQKFSLKIGTVFEDSPIPLEKWLPALWLVVTCKNGISSYELHRALGITQKSAWFMLHRVRLAMKVDSFDKTGTEYEADESFIGGVAKNMHKDKREKAIKGTGGSTKTAVMGILRRKSKKGGSKVRAKVIED